MTQLETYLREHEERFLEDLKGWLRIPSISTSPEHAADMQRAAVYAAEQLKQIGFESVELIQTQGHPLVSGHWLHAPGKQTLLIYGHYDVQPDDPVDQWISPPFEPTVRQGNLYARGASDDKGQVMMVLKALEALLAVDGMLPLNIRVLIEGEEESEGEAMEHYVREHPESLQCDAVSVWDMDMPRSDLPALVYRSRGCISTEVEVCGAKRDLHSGTFGGIAPNALHALSIMIGRLKDAQGHIHIPGLSDKLGQPSIREQTFWREDSAHLSDTYLKEMGVSSFSGEQEYPPLERIWARPSLEVHGIVGGFTDEGSKMVIPARARAKISMRFPPELKSDEVFERFKQAVSDAAPEGVEVSVHLLSRGEGVLVSPETVPMQAAAAALKETYGKDPLLIGEGGSYPVVALLSEILQVPIVVIGFGLLDDNVHAPNEKFSLDTFFKGIRTGIRFLQMMG